MGILFKIFDNGFTNQNRMIFILYVIITWFSVQCHSPALFFVFASFLFVFLKTNGKNLKIKFVLYIIILIFILQIPHLIHLYQNLNVINDYNRGTSKAFERFFLFQGAYGQGFLFIFEASFNILFKQSKLYPFILVYLYLLFVFIFKKEARTSLTKFSFLFILISYHCYSSLPPATRSDYLLLSSVFPLSLSPLILAYHYFIFPKNLKYFIQIIRVIAIIYFVPTRISQKDSGFDYYKTIVSSSRQIFDSHKEIKDIVYPKFHLPLDTTLVYEGFGGKVNKQSNIVAYVDMNGQITYK